MFKFQVDRPIFYSYRKHTHTRTQQYMCVCVHDNSKINGFIHLKLEHIVLYENSSDEFDIGNCQIHSGTLKIFLHLPQYKLSSPISQL